MSRRAAPLAVRFYAAILRLYPADFRTACEAPMIETFEALCRDRAARFGPIRCAAAAVGDLVNALGCAWRVRRPRPAGQVSAPATDGDSHMSSLVQDAAHALRRLASQPALVTFTVLTLGFAIAANAALFSIVDAVMLRPSPFTAADRLVNVINYSARGRFTFPGLTREKLRHWRTEREVFDLVEAYRSNAVVITGGLEPQEVPAAQLSPGLVAMLGVPPRHGRLFTADDLAEGQNRVALIGERFWRAHFGADTAAVGKSLTLNDVPHRIVGVMPERFHFPSLRQQIWVPIDPAAPSPGTPITVLARLRDGLTIPAAQGRIEAIVKRLEVEQPLPSGWGIRLSPEEATNPPGDAERAVLILFGAVGLVLLTACANVANVLLSRAVDRRREFAIRLALGASRLRLVRELVLEGMALGLLSAALGLTAAKWSLDTLVRLAPEDLAFVTTTPIDVDGRVLLFGLLLALLTGVLCNLPPALRMLQSRGTEALSGRSPTEAASPLQRRFRGTLVVLEVALSVTLLIGAALMARSFARLNAIDLGFEPAGVVAVTIGLDSARYDTTVAQVALLESVAADVAQLRGVQGVALSSGLPPEPGELSFAAPETDSGPCAAGTRTIVSNLVVPSYFSVLRLEILEGRAFTAADPSDAVVVSRALAARCGGGLAGRRLRLGPNAPWLTVVGVAADVKTLGLKNERGEMAVYSALSAGTFLLPNMATRTSDGRFVPRRLIVRAEEPTAIVPDIKRLLWAVDPNQPVLDATLAEDLMADTVRSERFVLTLMSLFSTVALALASAGIFGVLAYAVAQRTREIGIRMALGATPSDVLRLIVGHGMLLASCGVALGIAGALAVSRLLAGLLYEVDPRDPLAFATIAAVVLAVALAASWIPAIRAFRIEPAVALRND